LLKSLHRIKKRYIFVPTNKLKHKTMTTNNNNFRFTDPTNFASHVMPFCINGEIAEIELTDRPNDFVEVRVLRDGFLIVLNGEAIKKAVRWSTIEKHLNKINNK